MTTVTPNFLPGDLMSGTWRRVRTGLVRELWRLRGELEKDLSCEETAACRVRIRLVKEILNADPRKDDYALEPRTAPPLSHEFLVQTDAFVLEETLGDLPSPEAGRN